MSIYKIDSDLYTKSLLPINKRTSIHIEWLKQLNSQLFWLNKNLNEYVNGSSYSYWLSNNGNGFAISVISTGAFGSINSSTISSAGNSYSVGNSFIVNGGSVHATGIITGITGYGQVSSYSLLINGTGYLTASSYTSTLNLNVYNVGDRVNGGLLFNNNIYECISATSGSPGGTAWQHINNNFIGVYERYLYFNQKITMEFGLNRWFNTTFRQPNGVTYSSIRSDIYIDDNLLSYTTFLMAPSDFYSSTMGPSYSSSYMSPDGLIGSYYSTNNYTIYIPGGVFNNIPGGSQSVRNFVDKYNYYTIPYTITTY